MRTRRRFTAEFKETAVQWLAWRPVAEVARVCDVSVSVLHRWRRKLGDHAVTPVEGRRRFTKQFKASAVERLEREGRERGASHGTPHGTPQERGASGQRRASITEVAAALDVPPNTLHRWRKEAREFGGQAFSGYGKSRTGSQPARAIKISLQPDEYQRLRAAFDASSARSLPDFTRSRLLDATGEHHLEHDAEQDVEQALAEIHDKLDELAGILRRMAWIYAATCDSGSHPARSHVARFTRCPVDTRMRAPGLAEGAADCAR